MRAALECQIPPALSAVLAAARRSVRTVLPYAVTSPAPRLPVVAADGQGRWLRARLLGVLIVRGAATARRSRPRRQPDGVVAGSLSCAGLLWGERPAHVSVGAT